MNTLELENLKNSITKIQEASLQSTKVTQSNANLKKSIATIHTTFLSNWERDYLPEIRNLNQGIRQGIPTPVLTVCGRGTQEIRWTKYLSYYLNPQNNHGLSDTLCRTIVDQIQANQDITYANYTIIDVCNEVLLDDEINDNRTPEVGFKHSVCDIVIRTDKFTLFIEQKILSSEGTAPNFGLSQLRRYSEAISQNSEYSRLPNINIYLTPTGKLPEGINDWRPLRHSDIVASCIQLLKYPKLSMIAHDNLQRFIIDLTLGSSNQTEVIITRMKTLSDDLIEKGFNLYGYLQLSNLNMEYANLTTILKGEIS